MGEASVPATLKEVLDDSASKYGDKLALRVMDGGPEVTYKQLQAAVEGLAKDLLAIGVGHGALVSMAFPNTLEFVVAFLAVTRVRGIAAPLNAAYTEDEFKFYLDDAAAKVLLLPSLNPASAAQAAAASLKIPLALVHPYSAEPEPRVALELEEPPPPGTLQPPSAPSPDDEALFLHTSGTTSRPKGVPLAQKNLTASLRNISQWYELSPKDKTLIVMPLFHVHGLMAGLLSTLASGGTALLPSGGKFSASKFWADMRAGGATWYTAVPTIHQILLGRYEAHPDQVPHVRFIRSCSSSLAPAVLEKLEQKFKAPVLEAYAMTEASHQMCSNPLPAKGPHKPGVVGKPTGIDLAILDDQGHILPPGQIGEVCIKGPNVTAGYRNNPKANESSFAFGWFHTGDQGKLDDDRYLTLTGRLKELINRGGEKISPLEVDAALLAHPAVTEAVAFPAPSSHFGEEVNAAVVLQDGHTLTQEELQTFLKKQLAPFKVPKKIIFAKEVPRTSTGKIQRRFVAEVFLNKTEEENAAAPRTSAPTRNGGAHPSDVDGNEFAAKVLARLGVRAMFGVVGIPVTYFATACQKAGIRFIAFRNEQSAGYAASAYGYLTGVPGALLTVSGPGCVHGLAGLSNAMVNTWPMVLISGSSDQADIGKGDFQELDQVEAVKPFVKAVAKPKTLDDLPPLAEAAIKSTVSERPGGAYIDLPTDLLHTSIPIAKAEALLSKLQPISPPPAASSPPPPPHESIEPQISEAFSLLKSAHKPIIVFGKGAAYARAEGPLRDFIEATKIPFVATPMAKGVVPDTHALSAAAARSLALGQADVALVVGARLNWMLHFGEAPKWAKDVKFILVNVDKEEVALRKPAVGVVGDAKTVLGALLKKVKEEPFELAEDSEWRKLLQSKVSANSAKLVALLSKDTHPLNFHCSLRIIKDAIAAVESPAPILVSEGANTMDIGRTVLEQSEPRTRLDAGTWGTMGVGLGYAIAAAVAEPQRLVVAVEGDSAFGFSGMEVETIVRYNFPIVVIIMNNNGVYGGDRRGEVGIPPPFHKDPPPTSFVDEAKYHLLADAFGGKGYVVSTVSELSAAVKEAFGARRPAVINVIIDPFAGSESGGMTHRN